MRKKIIKAYLFFHQPLVSVLIVEIEDLLNESYSLPKSDLSQHFDTILQRINTMEKKITEALDYIPSYDERQFSLVIKEKSKQKGDGLTCVYVAIEIAWR